MQSIVNFTRFNNATSVVLPFILFGEFLTARSFNLFHYLYIHRHKKYILYIYKQTKMLFLYADNYTKDSLADNR